MLATHRSAFTSNSASVPAGRGTLAFAGLLLLLVLSACAAVGPNYEGPPEVAEPAIDSPRFARAESATTTPAPPPARWWESVDDPVLTRLIDDAFAASPTLQSAVARVRSALAQGSQSRAALGPTGGGGARYVRGRIPTGSVAGGAGGGGTGGSGGPSIPDPIDIDTSSVSFNATWELDLFGGRRRDIESAEAQAQAQQAALEDAQVSLANDMVQAYARLREAQGRRALALKTIALRQRSLDLVAQRQARGAASVGDVERANSDLAQAEAELPQIETQLEQQLDQIALLAGREPGAVDALLATAGETNAGASDKPLAPPLPPLPPDSVPVGTPADWLRRRPDIRQAERTLAARNAVIGSRVAALFPTVSLLGFIGTSGAHPSDLFRTAPLWLLTPSLTWNFLDIPANQARVRGAEADRDQSLADYRRSVLTALQDANDSLSRFGRARQTLAARDKAREAARRAADSTRRRYEGGTASLIDALDAERQRAQADDQWLQARSGLLVTYASLQKSLGLGWGAPPPTSGDPTRVGSRDPVDPVGTRRGAAAAAARLAF